MAPYQPSLAALILRSAPLPAAVVPALVDAFGARLAPNPSITGTQRAAWLARRCPVADAVAVCSVELLGDDVASILEVETRRRPLRALAQHNDRSEIAELFARYPHAEHVSFTLPPSGAPAKSRFYVPPPPVLGPKHPVHTLGVYTDSRVSVLEALKVPLRRGALGHFAAELGDDVDRWVTAVLLADGHRGSLAELAEVAAVTTSAPAAA